MSKVVGYTIIRNDVGFEPCKVLDDLSTKLFYPEPLNLSSADAIREGRSIARAHKLPFRSRLSAFNSLIKEASINA